MTKRILVLFGFFMVCFCFMIFSLDFLSSRDILQIAAIKQQSYTLKIAQMRGTIYDCRGKPLVNNGEKLVAAAIPCTEALNLLTPAVSEENTKLLYEKCSGNSPFSIEVNKKVENSYVKTFRVPVRYSGITIAPHILGYINSDKKGVYGIEKAFEDYLASGGQDIFVKYNVDAKNRTIPGEKRFAEDKLYLKSKGVVLNIDSKIQNIAEEATNKYLASGAVIISEIPNNEIRACISVPSFLPQKVSDYLNDENSPLLNKVLCEYNSGSIFKLITSATALEKGISENFEYECIGKYELEDVNIKCNNGKKHEKVNMEDALAKSCNGYFIALTTKITPDELLKMAKKFKLGEEINFMPNLNCQSGKLPSRENLENPKTFAQISFGQGKLMVTPLQILGLINTIASDGVYSNPKLIKTLVNEAMKPIETNFFTETYRVISEKIAKILKKHMKASVERGTSSKGKPNNVEAAAKTSTAQTGIIKDGKKIERAWYAGFFPFENPRYNVVVLSENGNGGGLDCGPVFKEIAEKICSK